MKVLPCIFGPIQLLSAGCQATRPEQDDLPLSSIKVSNFNALLPTHIHDVMHRHKFGSCHDLTAGKSRSDLRMDTKHKEQLRNLYLSRNTVLLV
jgi:hypothetical protein